MAATTIEEGPERRSTLPPWRGHPRALVALGALLLQPALAADWTFKPAVEVRESYSDNVRLLPGDARQGDFVNEVLPQFSLRGTGRRLNLNLDYTLDALTYARDSSLNTIMHDLHGDVSAELVDQFLYFDGRAAVSQQNFSAFGPQITDNVQASGNRVEVRTASLSPYLRHRFGNLAGAELRYTHDIFRSSSRTLPDTYTDRANFLLNNGPAFGALGWGLSYNDQKTHYADGASIDTNTYSGNLRYALTPTFALTASAGHERYGYVPLADRSEGGMWSAGFSWRPSTRTTLDASAGHRFFGDTWSLAANHRARRTVWVLQYNEEITTTQSQYLSAGSINTAGFLDRLWTTAIPDAAARRDVVEAFIRDTGLPASIPNSVDSFSNRFFLQKTLQASVAFNGARNTAIVNAYLTTRSPQSKLNVNGAFAGDGPLADFDGARERGIQGLWRWRLSPASSANFSAGIGKVSSSTAARENLNKTLRLALTHQFSRKLNGAVELRHVRQSALDSGGSARENALAASLTANF